MVKIQGCFMNEWKKLDDDRIIKVCENYSVIKPIDETHAYLECPVCNLLLGDDSDVNSIEKYECCFECSLIFAQPNREKWLTGWRPDSKLIDLELSLKDG